MGVVITLSDIRAYAEVDYIINHLNEKYRNMVPKKMLDFFSDFKDPNYVVKINPYIPLQNQGLQRYTLEILALLHLKYWCEDEKRKQELYDIMLHNQEKLEEQMNNKYNVDNIFGNSESTSVEEDDNKTDFSRPRVVQRYNIYTENNEDIQDYTDHVEVEENENLPVENQVKEKKNIFVKIKEMFLSIFAKK